MFRRFVELNKSEILKDSNLKNQCKGVEVGLGTEYRRFGHLAGVEMRAIFYAVDLSACSVAKDDRVCGIHLE